MEKTTWKWAVCFEKTSEGFHISRCVSSSVSVIGITVEGFFSTPIAMDKGPEKLTLSYDQIDRLNPQSTALCGRI